MPFQMRIDARSRKAARFVGKVHGQIQNAFVRHRTGGKPLTQQQLAERLGVDRSTVNRRLLGEGNLTLRTIADFAWALDCDIDFALVPTRTGGNHDLADVTAKPLIESDTSTSPISVQTTRIVQPENA